MCLPALEANREEDTYRKRQHAYIGPSRSETLFTAVVAQVGHVRIILFERNHRSPSPPPLSPFSQPSQPCIHHRIIVNASNNSCTRVLIRHIKGIDTKAADVLSGLTRM